jgi:hypothetical protein
LNWSNRRSRSPVLSLRASVPWCCRGGSWLLTVSVGCGRLVMAGMALGRCTSSFASFDGATLIEMEYGVSAADGERRRSLSGAAIWVRLCLVHHGTQNAKCQLLWNDEMQNAKIFMGVFGFIQNAKFFMR